MTDKVTPEEAQLARLSWVLTQGAKNAGVTFSVQGIQRLALSMHRVMVDEGIFFDYQARVDREAAAMEADVT